MSLKLPPPLDVETMMGAIDESARRTAGAARAQSVAAVKRVMPARTGRARSATSGSVRRTSLGFVITVKPSARVRYPNGVTAVEVTRFVSGGTGVAGPQRRLIPFAKRGRLPGGARPTGRGQAPQRIYERAFTSSQAVVSRLLQAGAENAAREADRVLGGRHG